MDLSSVQQISSRTAVSDKTPASDAEPFWGKDGFTFGDVIDMFNPLQHLPFAGKYYREQTHDDACEGSKIIGGVVFGALFGGASGIVSSIANSAVRHETHQDVSEHLLALAEDSSQQSNKIVENGQMTESRPVSNAHNTINPFFAQLFDEYSNESYSSSQSGTSKDWGKV